MSSNGNSGKSKGGVWASLGRMFGGGKRDKASGPEQETGTNKPTANKPTATEQVTEAAPAGGEGDDGDDDALILGPAMQPAAAEEDSDADQSGEGESEGQGQDHNHNADETSAVRAEDEPAREAEAEDETANGDDDDDMGDDQEEDDGLIRASAESGAELTLIAGGLAAVDTGDETPEADQEETAAEAGEDDPDGQPEPSDAGAELDSAPDSDAGGAPDAQELEDTIRRVLREELAGEMGQRLSQNLKRMIRDEIANAMSRRD